MAIALSINYAYKWDQFLSVQQILGVQKVYFTGSVLNFMTEVQKILRNNMATIREIHGVPMELFNDPVEGLYLIPREVGSYDRSKNF